MLLKAHRDAVLDVDASSTAGLFATASTDKTMKIWKYSYYEDNDDDSLTRKRSPSGPRSHNTVDDEEADTVTQAKRATRAQRWRRIVDDYEGSGESVSEKPTFQRPISKEPFPGDEWTRTPGV